MYLCRSEEKTDLLNDFKLNGVTVLLTKEAVAVLRPGLMGAGSRAQLPAFEDWQESALLQALAALWEF